MSYTIPAYQRRMMGYDQPGGLRSVASSYTGALLTIGMRVRQHGSRPDGPIGVIVNITELGTARGGWVRVRWSDGQSHWYSGEDLMRVGKAV